MIQSINERAARQTAESLAKGDQLGRLLDSRRKAFDEAQAMRSHQHQEFMDSLQRGQDLRNSRFQEQQYVKRQNAEDWCDYALDCPGVGTIESGSAIAVPEKRFLAADNTRIS